MREARVLSTLVVGLLLGSGPARAAAPGESKPPAKVSLPADLDLVPRDATGFIHLRLMDLWQSDWIKDFRHLVQRAGPEAWKAFVKKCPVDPAMLERMTLILLTPQTLASPFPTVDPEAMSAVVVMTTRKPYQRLSLIQALASREKIYRNNVYYFNEELWSGLVPVDEHTFLIGSEDALIRFFDMSRHPDRGGSLQSALVEAAGKHQVVVGLNPQLLGKEEASRGLPQSLRDLLGARSGILALDLDKGINLQVRLDFLNENEARAGEKALRGTLDLGRQGLMQSLAELEGLLKDPDRAASSDLFESFSMLVGLGFLRELDTILKEAPVQRQGLAVKLPLTYRKMESAQWLFVFSLASLGRFASSTFDFVGEKVDGRKDPVEERLKKLAGALDRYHEKHGNYPPAAICDQEGRPILSWRVALLPYMGEEALYQEFKLDEPWDSLHNKRLLKKLPRDLQPNSFRYRTRQRWKTTTQVFVGDNTAFDGKKGVRKRDVAGQTILLAHLSEEAAVYWTKPADVPYSADKPLPNLFGRRGYQFKVLLQDGTIRSIERERGEKPLRALIERRGDKPPR